jgi:hypothetical protein
VSTIAELVERHGGNTEALVGALQEREDNMRERLNMAGQQFGLMPFIVAAVLMDVGLGTPPSPEEEQLIRQNYINGVQAIREGRNPMAPPDAG